VTRPSHSDLAGRIELAITNPMAARAEIEKLCADACASGFYGLGVSSSWVALAQSLFEESSLKVIGLVAFPWGAADADVKRFETETAVDLGAQEIEFVVNLGRLKDGDYRYVLRELRDVAEAADERPVKAVLETSLLTADELKLACELVLDSGVDGVCTGLSHGPAPEPAQVRALRSWVGPKLLVKAAGQIPDAAAALALVQAGAERLGVADLTPPLILEEG
jgi:deoxyribose-phosphate aldolase